MPDTPTKARKPVKIVTPLTQDIAAIVVCDDDTVWVIDPTDGWMECSEVPGAEGDA